MRTLQDQLQLVVQGGNVRRYHTVTTHTQETVGHHSYTVAWLLTLMYDGHPPAVLLLAALQHDIAEVETGDIPAPFKRKVAGLRDQFNAHEAEVVERCGMINYAAQLAETQAQILKLADSMAGMVLCLHERGMGNRHVELAYSRFRDYVRGILSVLDKNLPVALAAAELFFTIEKQMEDYTHGR